MRRQQLSALHPVQNADVRVPDAPRPGRVVILERVEHAIHRPAHVRNVELQVFPLLPLLFGLLPLCELCPELRGALLQGLLDRPRDLVVVPDVLLARALERDLRAHDADEDAHALLQPDLVTAPLHRVRRLGDDVIALLEEQRDPVGEPKHVELVLLDGGVLPADAHGRLNDERVALQRDRGALVGGHHVRVELLHHTQPQVVFPGRRKVLAVRVGEPDLLHELVQPEELRVRHLLGGYVDVSLALGPGTVRAAQLCDQPPCQARGDVAELAAQELAKLFVGAPRDLLLQQLQVDVARVMLRLPRRVRHAVSAPRVRVKERVLLVLGDVPKVEGGVGRDDCDQLEVLEELLLVAAKVSLDRHADLRAGPVVRVLELFVLPDHRRVLVQVDVEPVERNEVLPSDRAAHLHGLSNPHLGPDQDHLGTQTELSPRLHHRIVLGAAQHPTEHVRDVVAGHAAPVVLARQPVEDPPGLGRRGLPARLLPPQDVLHALPRLCGLFLGVLLRPVPSLLLLLLPRIALLLGLHVLVQALIHPLRGLHPVQLTQGLRCGLV